MLPNHPSVKRLSKSRLGMQPVNNGDVSDLDVQQGDLVIGSGWHPALFRAEVSALTSNIDESLTPRILHVPSSKGLEGAATVDQILRHFGISTIENLDNDFSDWLEVNSLSIDQTVAVRWSRHGERTSKGIELAKRIGGILHSNGFRIDLEEPEQTIQLLISGSDLFWGIPQLSEPPRKEWKNRVATRRPFFKPVSLDPQHARLMINLTGNGGPVLDPMCGTGGLLIESTLMGLESTGVDLDPEMVEGSKKNLQWCGGHAKVIHGDATQLAHLDIGGFRSVCFDPPYGRNAWRSDSILNLFTSVLNSIHSVCEDGAVMCCMLPADVEQLNVMGMKWQKMKELFDKTGWRIDGDWKIPVHASLSRRLVRAVRIPV
tara:strand:+ start:4218 stop:5339 length:1122 start_codon:yes stop_codon:yes gene_type:complete